jgi:hypothetical protein
MTTELMHSVVTGSQNSVESHPTFTLNVELYRLTVLAMREIFRQQEGRPRHLTEVQEFQNEGWEAPSPRVATTRAEVSARSSIDIALVADFTRTR